MHFDMYWLNDIANSTISLDILFYMIVSIVWLFPMYLLLPLKPIFHDLPKKAVEPWNWLEDLLLQELMDFLLKMHKFKLS